MVAWSSVPELKLVGNDSPFQRTSESLRKLLPETRMRNPALPAAASNGRMAVIAGALDGATPPVELTAGHALEGPWIWVKP